MLGCWGAGVLGCWGAGVLGCWGAGVLGCWGVYDSFEEIRFRMESGLMKFKIVVVPLVLGILIASPSASFADYDYIVNGTEGNWIWDIDDSATDGVDDLEIQDLNGDQINGDGFDEFGQYYIDGDSFDTSSSDGDIVGGQITFSGTMSESTEGGTVTWTFSNNNWQQVLTSSSSGSLEIYGDLGSDGSTTWLTLGSYLISYEADDATGPDNDPILLWESDGEITTDGEVSRIDGDDNIKITKNGTSLTVTIFAYAHDNDGSLDTASYFNLFESFVNENKYRTDIFSPSWTPVKREVIALRQNVNLSFAESQYGSDMLSDPDGELRKLINLINLRYGTL